MNRTGTLFFSLLLILLPVMPVQAGSEPVIYAVARIPTPVLNTPDFSSVFGGNDGKTLRLDRSGLIREVEFVALPGTVFRVEDIFTRNGHDIYRISTDDYPYPVKTGYFIDSRFVTGSAVLPSPRKKNLPAKSIVIENLLAALGSRYVWGGNVRAGIPQLVAYYPPRSDLPLPGMTLEMWQLKGVDCSGLLYEATDGYTPRNTSSLVEYGRPVRIEGLNAGQIIELLEPLDLIVWSGHVMIVLDKEREIESRLDRKDDRGGVVVRSLRAALGELLKGRKALDDYGEARTGGEKGFVIRRWYHDKPEYE